MSRHVEFLGSCMIMELRILETSKFPLNVLLRLSFSLYRCVIVAGGLRQRNSIGLIPSVLDYNNDAA